MGRDGGIGGGFGYSKGGITARSLPCPGFDGPSSKGLLGLPRFSADEDDGGESEGAESEGGETLEPEECRRKDERRNERASTIKWPSRADRKDSFEMLEELEDLFDLWPLAKSRSAAAAALAARPVDARPFIEDFNVLFPGAVPSLSREALPFERGIAVWSPPLLPAHSTVDERAWPCHLTQLKRW